MRKKISSVSVLAGSLLLASAAHAALPMADFNDGQLQDRWNRQAETLSLKNFTLKDCKPDTTSLPGKQITVCRSTSMSGVYFIRSGGKVVQVQYVSKMNMASFPLEPAARLMVRFLHENTSGVDASLLGEFMQMATRSKRYCVPDAATSSQLCYLTDGRNYAVEIK